MAREAEGAPRGQPEAERLPRVAGALLRASDELPQLEPGLLREVFGGERDERRRAERAAELAELARTYVFSNSELERIFSTSLVTFNFVFNFF